LFSKETVERIAPRLKNLDTKHGFDSVLELMSILHDLSISRNIRMLSNAAFNNTSLPFYNSRRIEKAVEYMNQNFNKLVKLNEVAKQANMTETAFSRFFKTRTGISFIDYLNEIRLGNASRMLIDTTESIAEIAYDCGFSNISNFNRIFKKKKGITPKGFRESYSNAGGTRIFI
jgi:transcriptional regulator GlxA family with amidase domain